MNVADNVRQLKSDATVDGGSGCGLFAESPDVDAGQANGRSDTVAVFTQLFERCELNRFQVHFNAVQDVIQVLFGDGVPDEPYRPWRVAIAR